MVESKNLVQEFNDSEGGVSLLLKIWCKKEHGKLGLSDILHLPGHYELIKSSEVVYNLVEQYVLETLFGCKIPSNKESTGWHIVVSNEFRLTVKATNTKTKIKILKAVEVLCGEPLLKGSACFPLPDDSEGRWCYSDGDFRLIYKVNEINKKLSLIRSFRKTRVDENPSSPGDQ
jgi:mRNA-degrading endonuclease YafQ of YafQ-DinJ toxin-antitoxin module